MLSLICRVISAVRGISEARWAYLFLFCFGMIIMLDFGALQTLRSSWHLASSRIIPGIDHEYHPESDGEDLIAATKVGDDTDFKRIVHRAEGEYSGDGRQDMLLASAQNAHKLSSGARIHGQDTIMGCSSETADARWRSVQAMWLAVMCLLMRPHNVVLVVLLAVVEKLSSGSVLSLNQSSTSLILYCLMMGQAFFYIQVIATLCPTCTI